MAGREVKDRKRLAYTFTLHKEKDAELIKFLEDKSITGIVKEVLESKRTGALNIPPGKILIEQNELLRLVSLVTGGISVPSAVSNKETEVVLKTEKTELTEEEKQRASKIANKVKLGINKNRQN